jgi:Uma2 family endonuclease
MVNTTAQQLSKTEFWALADGAEDVTYELIDGSAVAKVSPKYFHAKYALALVRILDRWSTQNGRLGLEWAFDLNENSTPVPDLLYVSFARLPETWHENEACPVPPELAIEVLSPGQTFGQMTKKASLYLAGGVLRVWVVDPVAQTLTVFYPDAPPVTYGASQEIADDLFPGLLVAIDNVFL